MIKRRVVILCTGNAARSQMAEGLLRALSGGALDVVSAGIQPSSPSPTALKQPGRGARAGLAMICP